MTDSRPIARPPRLARALLRVLTRHDRRGELLHELDDEYQARAEHEGWLAPRIWYWGEVMSRDLLRLRRAQRRRAANLGRRGGPLPSAESLRPDLLRLEFRQALRSIRRRPLGSVGFMGLLGLSVATATLVFSLVDGIVRQPAPYPDADKVVLVGPRWLDGREPGGSVSTAEYLDVAAGATVFETSGALEQIERTLITDGPPVEIVGARVTASALRALGVSAALGRTFTPEESAPGGADVVLLSDGLWRGAFGGDESVLGATVQLEERRYEVVGVMPAGFILPTEIGAPERSGFFVPLVVDAADPGPYFVKELDAIVARVRVAASGATITADVERLAAEIIVSHPDNYRADEWTLRAYSPVLEAVARARPVLRLLTLAVGFLVLAVGANLAGMLASRIEERRAAIVIRSALGAGRLHLVRSMLVEAAVLTAIGAVAGTAAAAYALPLLKRALAGSLPRLGEVGLDFRVAAVPVGLALLAAVVFSLIPALRIDIGARLQDVGSGVRATAGRSRFRRVLIASQLALASVLLCGSLMFVRSLTELVQTDPGFDSSNVQTVELSVPRARYESIPDVESFYVRLLAQLERAAGVEAVGLARRRPMADRYGTWTAAVRGDGEPRRLDDAPPRWQVVTSGYFDAMSIGVESGRLFTAADFAGAEGVALVNAAFERAHWPGRSALATEIRMDGGSANPWLRIVGVVADVSTGGPRQPTMPVLYVPHGHFDEATSMGTQRSMSLVLRTSLDLAATRELVQSRLRELDPQLPMGAIRSMDEIVAAAHSDTRILTQVLALFALLSLGLGALGTYGTLAQEVASRMRELGIRAALGASRARLLRDVLAEGLGVAAVGAGVGLVFSYAAANLIGSYLFGVEARDPATFLTVGAILLGSSALASYTPARRASGADPTRALRAE